MLDQNEKNLYPADESAEMTGDIEETTENLPEEAVSAGNDAKSSGETGKADEAGEEYKNADDDSGSEDEYDEYDEYDEDDEDNLAAVAERITGERHTIAATAAPIRIREATGRVPTVPKPTAGIPVREKTDVPQEPAENAGTEPGKKAKHKKTFAAVVSSAVALIAVLTVLILLVNGTAEKERPADITIGESTAADAEIIKPDMEPAPGPETNEMLPADETDIETEEPVGPAPEESAEPVEPVPEESEEPVPETEPSAVETDPPVVETEPETEPEPEPVKFTVTLDFYDRDDITVVTEAITLNDLLAQVGCTLTDADVPSVTPDSLIAADSVITIDKLSWGTDTVTETIPYETEVIEVDTIPRDTTNYLQAGEYGEITKTYAVEYLNSAERSRSLTSEETTKWPVSERYELGVGGSFVGADGNTYTYSYRRVVPATYYNIEGLTYLGTMADETVIAVNRSNIPLGTKLYVKNDSYDFGVRIASDVGSMIDGWEIDIWLSDDNPQFASFAHEGYHYDMEIYYID